MVVRTPIDEYMTQFPKATQVILRKIRATIKPLIPHGVETMSYGLATFDLHGHVVHFGAFAKHIGFYPTPSAITAFAEELRPYQQSKGAVQFPLDQPIPYTLIGRMVEYRVREQLEREAIKEAKRKKR